MDNIKKYTLFIFIGFIILLVSFVRPRLTNFSETTYQITTNQFGLVFYSSDLSKQLFKISPFDDYYYKNTTKQHLTDSNNLKETNTFQNQIIDLFSKLVLGKNQKTWTTEFDNKKVKYAILSKPNNQIEINRQLINFDKDINVIGQSIVLCESCSVTDQSKHIYIDQQNIYKNLDFIQTSGLTPVFISDGLLPFWVKNFSIIDRNLNTVYTIFLSENQIAFYDTRWNLFEIIGSLDKKHLTQSPQIITVNK